MSGGIAHQNKDIMFKILSDHYRNKSLKVYGLDLPPIREVLPTNLPSIKLDEKHADNVFMLEDSTILIMEYESKVSNENLIKYGHYAFRVSEAYYKEIIHKVIIVVIYTGDIETAPNSLNLGCIQLSLEQVFLSALDGNVIYDELKAKIHNKNVLTDEDIMRFIILPLTQRNTKQEMIENAINLAKEIDDGEKQSFIIAGILSAADKFIDQNYSSRVKEWLRMTKIGRLYEEEKIDAINETKQEIAKKLLENNIDILTVMKSTGLSKTEILRIKEEDVNA